VRDDAPPTPVPDPVRPPRGWRLPEAAWPGRIIFFACGAAITVACFFAAMWYSFAAYSAGSPLPDWPGVLLASIPVLVFAWIVVMRVRRGKRWRWLSFLAGGYPPAAIAVLLVLFFVRSWKSRRT
jgi:hypothetical protein